MRRNTKSLLMITALLVALLASACSASKAEKLNQEGNDAFAEQAFQDALVAYQTAQIEEPELAEPYYNAANALYRQGAYADALKQMEMALSYASEESLAQAGLYNLGNSSYNQQDLQTAVDSYKQALLLNPDDQDAKYNLELALQQLQQQQQNEQQQEEEQQDQSGQGDEQQEQDQSGEGESQDEQQQEQSQDQQDGEGDQQQEQDQSGQGDEEQPAEQQDGQESDQGQEGQEQQDEGQQQGQGEDQQDQQDQEQQGGQGQPQEGQPDENQQGQLNQLPAPGQRMTEEQAEQLLAAIARDGQTLQEKLGQIFAVPWTPPVQDW